MTEDASDHSEAVQKYIDATPESTFEFDRLEPEDDDSLYDSERTVVDESE